MSTIELADSALSVRFCGEDRALTEEERMEFLAWWCFEACLGTLDEGEVHFERLKRS